MRRLRHAPVDADLFDSHFASDLAVRNLVPGARGDRTRRRDVLALSRRATEDPSSMTPVEKLTAILLECSRRGLSTPDDLLVACSPIPLSASQLAMVQRAVVVGQAVPQALVLAAVQTEQQRPRRRRSSVVVIEPLP